MIIRPAAQAHSVRPWFSTCSTLVFFLGINVALAQDCPPAPTTHPNGVIEGPVTPTGPQGSDGTVALDGSGRFIVVYQEVNLVAGNNLLVERFDENGVCVCNPGDSCPALLSDPEVGASHFLPSVAMTPGAPGQSPLVFVSWIGVRERLLAPAHERPEGVASPPCLRTAWRPPPESRLESYRASES